MKEMIERNARQPPTIKPIMMTKNGGKGKKRKVSPGVGSGGATPAHASLTTAGSTPKSPKKLQATQLMMLDVPTPKSQKKLQATQLMMQDVPQVDNVVEIDDDDDDDTLELN